MGGRPPDLLIGREPELARLCRALRSAESHAGSVVVVEGEAGIGKTRLVAEVCARARRTGFRVYSGSAEELEQTRPFSLLQRTLATEDPDDPLATTVRRSLDGGPGDPHLAIQRELSGALAGACDAAPVVMVLEDLHWADEASLRVVAAVARGLPELRAMLLVTRRPSPVPPHVERALEALEAQRAERLVLGPLPEPDQAIFVRQRLGADPEPKLLERVAGAGGNPFYLAQLLDVLLDAAGIEVTGGRAQLVDVALPRTLRETLIRRLRFLGDEPLHALRIAAVLGSEFSVGDVALVMGRRATEVAGDLYEALRAELLEEHGDRIVFRHDLIREAVYEDVALPVRVALHRDAARAMLEAGRSALDIADHLVRGASSGDRWAVESLYHAALEAWERSPVAACRIAKHAAELADEDDPLRDRLLALQAELMVWTDDLEAGLELAQQLLERPQDPDALPHVSGVVHRGLHVQGRWKEAMTWAMDVAAHPSLSADDQLTWRALAAQDRLLTGDVVGAREDAAALLAEAERSGNEAVSQGCLITLAWAASFDRDIAQAADLAERAARLPVQDHHTVDFAVGVVLADVDRLDDAQDAFARGRHRALERGIRSHLVLAHWGSAGVHYLTGSWEDAVAQADAGLELVVGTTIGQGTPMAYAIKALVAVHRGDLAQARSILDEHDRRVSSIQIAADWAAWARGLLLEAEGDTDGALAALERAWYAHHLLRLLSGYRGIGPDLVRLAVQRGRMDIAHEVTEEVEAIAGATEVAGIVATALRCRALLDGDPDTLLAAVEAYRRCPRVIDLATACEDAGVSLQRAGRAEEATRMLSEALEVYERVGAHRLVARAAAQLRDLGVRPGRRGARGRPKTGWASLTPTELEVVRLAVEGLSNPAIGERLFVTRRTVSTHLSNVYAKLGVASRAELARAYGARPALTVSAPEVPAERADGDDGDDRKPSRASS